ncbi:MAG: hypothetical protein H6Q69_4284 [Firmicutes bacterium]|nr:hypothetical protein [Bacillota bacterium]
MKFVMSLMDMLDPGQAFDSMRTGWQEVLWKLGLFAMQQY